MKQTLCSVLIPTKGRPEELVRAVESVRRTSNPEKVEVILWFDHGDRDYDELKVAYLTTWPNVWFAQGKPEDPTGYEHLHVYYDRLSLRARGLWVLIFNDDATIAGNGWDEQLASIPTTGVIVHPERHSLGGSRYVTGDSSPFPFVPLNCWRYFGNPSIPAMVDTAFDQMLRVQNGWQVRKLSGVSIHHNRKIDKTLPRERY